MSYASAPGFLSSVGPTPHPLVANYTVGFVPQQATVTVQFGPDTNYGRTTSFQEPPDGGGPVSFLVAGMTANTTFHMRAVTQMPDGSVVLDPDFTFTTGSLPALGIPKLSVTQNGAPAPGVELVNLIDPPHISVATDLAGNVIWYYHNAADDAWKGYAMPIRPLDNGNFLVNIINLFAGFEKPQSALREVTLDGTAVQEIDLATMNALLKNVPTSKGSTVQALTYSHDAVRLSNGYTAVIVMIGNPPVEGLVGDAVVVLDLSFQPVWVWSSFDWLDTNRRPWTPDPSDWTHCNTIAETADGNLLLSVRAQSWILKLDYQGGSGSGGILWTLGYEGTFTLVGSSNPADWFYNQHCPIILSSDGDGNIVTMSLFDNGDERPGTPQPYSRAILMQIDEPNQQATITWDYRPPAPNQYSYWGGNVWPLSNGNIEVDIPSPPQQTDSAVQEVTADTQELVWQLNVDPPAVYRSFRLPSLYFGVQWS